MNSGESSYRRYLEGDKKGFDEVIDLYHDNLIYFLKRYVSSEQDAEDIAADTFVEMLIHPSRFNFKCSLKTYIFSVARHKAIDFARKNNRLVFSDEWDVLPTTDGADALLFAEKNEESQKIRDAMANIGREYREVLCLVYYENMSSDDIMKIMKKNKRQISNLLYRAKAALKNELTKGGFSYDG